MQVLLYSLRTIHLLVTGEMFLSLILNIYTPFRPTLLVDATSITKFVLDIGIIVKSLPTPLLNPIWAWWPPRPLVPPSSGESPVVHWICPSAYKNIA